MPTDLDSAFWILFEDTERRCDAASRRLRTLDRGLSGRLEERSYRTFVDVLALLTSNVRSFACTRAAVFRGTDVDQSRRSTYKLLRNVAEQFADKVESPLNLLEAGRTEIVELFAGPMSRLVKQVVPDAEVVFLPWARSGYEIGTFTAGDADHLLSSGGAVVRREFGQLEILQLRYPSARGAEVFQHAVFAHELAHAALAQPARSRGAVPPDVSGRPLSWDVVAAGALPTHTPEAKTDAAALRNWFTELACDVVAMRLIGPAFAVAYAEVTAVHRKPQQDESPSTHPAPAIRFRVLGEELERFCEVLPTEMAEPLRAYARVHEGTHGAPLPSPPAAQWLDDALARLRDDCLPTILEGVGAEYRPAALALDLSEVRAAISRDVYPAERVVAFDTADGVTWSTPLDWRSILNVTLLDLLAKTGGPGGEDGSAHATLRPRALALAVGGMELSELHRRAAALIAQAEPLAVPLEDE